jgi:hypothetical protein
LSAAIRAEAARTGTAELGHKAADIANIIIQSKIAFRWRDVAGIRPVGNVKIVMGKKRFGRAAQQRRKMPGHGSDEKCLGIIPFYIALEMQEITIGLCEHRSFVNGDIGAVDAGRRQVETWLVIQSRTAIEELGGGFEFPLRVRHAPESHHTAGKAGVHRSGAEHQAKAGVYIVLNGVIGIHGLSPFGLGESLKTKHRTNI